ncbi:MAG: Glycosyltransferase, partial [Parcubacteria group bacterium GW2011_GWA2_47_9]
ADLNVEPKKFPEFDKTILMVSRLTSEKNVGLAIDAMAEVLKKHPKAGLIIVGDGPEREALELKTKSYKLQANVKFKGWQNDTAPYYKGADIFLLTSWYEGWGMSAVEAMRYGAAVVMDDVGLAGEVVEDGKTGLVVPVGDKNALVGAITRLLENDELRRYLVEEAAKKVQKLPSAEEYYERMVDSWQKCA